MAIKHVLEILPQPLSVVKKKKYKPKNPAVVREGQETYENGYPLSDATLQFLDGMIKRLDNNYPAAVIVEGGQGKGKTTLATHMGDYIQGSPINLDVESKDSQIAYPGSYVEKLDNAYIKGQKVLILDEASFLSGINAGKKEVRNIVELWNTIRQYGIFVILCLPQAHILYSPLIDQDVVRALVRMDRRDEKESRFMWFDIHKMLKLRERQKKSFDPASAYGTVYQTNTGVAKRLPPASEKALDEVSMAGKTEVRIRKLIAEKGFLTTAEIAAQFGNTTRWAQMQVKSFEPSLVEKNIRYYSPEVIDLIGRKMD